MPIIEEASTLADVARAQGNARGDATAFEFEGRVASFADFDRNTNRVANALSRPVSSLTIASPISARTAIIISNYGSAR